MFKSAYLSKIYKYLSDMDEPKTQIELEAKFGYYKLKKNRSKYRETIYDDCDYKNNDYNFVSDVGWRKFKALKNELLKRGFVPVQQHITDFISSDIRKQVIIVEGQPQKVNWQRKTKRCHFSDGPFLDYGVRVTISTEIDDVSEEEITGFKDPTIRIKDRTSYYYGDGGFLRIDMTEVTTVGSDNITYEVEVEILRLYEEKLTNKFVEFNKLLSTVFKLINDTLLLYTKYERQNLAKFINVTLGERERVFLNYEMVANARNLKVRDMVWGGLIGNKLNGEQNRYSVTHKADGLRKFLVVDYTGIWLVYPDLEFNLVFRFTEKKNARWLSGLILDGELIPRDDAHRRVRDLMGRMEAFAPIPGIEEYSRLERKKLKFVPEAKYWFLVFDALATDGNKDLQKYPHSVRLKEAYQEINQLHDVTDNQRLVISFKSFRQITSPEQFFPLMQQMLAEKGLLPYEDDGFIFTPEMAPYNPIRYTKLKLKDRWLVKQSDICKWKPVRKLTIDFSIRHRGDGKVDLLSKGRGRNLVLFDGTTYNPFDADTMIVHDHPLIADHPTGAILEFTWDMERGFFFPLKARPDKKNPNTIEVAEDNWGMIHNPVTEETLKGENFTLMRKYHNRLKRDLFRTSTPTKHGEKFLLDIGSGEGGDVDKWKVFDKIVAVEPSTENLGELERRIRLHKMENKVKIVQAGGEDTEIITKAVQDFMGRKVDVVSLMMSMTFFWKSPKMLQTLVETIDANLMNEGSIILMTMDGDTVEEVFEPYFPGYRYSKLIFHQTTGNEGYAILKVQPLEEVKKEEGRKVWVYIQDSIVGKEIKGVEPLAPRFGNLPVIQPSSSESIPIPIEHTHLPVIFTSKRVRSITHPSPKSKIVFQEEYLVHLMDFERLLSKKRVITSKKINRADKQTFLTNAEKGFSLMYSYGIYEVSENVHSFLEHEYMQYQLVRDIRSFIMSNYDNPELILEQLSLFLYLVSQEYGNPIQKLPLSNSKYQDFIQGLKDSGLTGTQAAEIAQYIISEMDRFHDHPPTWTLKDEDVIRRGDVFSLVKTHFYIHPDIMSFMDFILSEDTKKENLSKILTMLLRHYTVFQDLRPFHLPKQFYQNLANKWKKDLILDADATPLTAQMHLLKEGKAQVNFASLFPDVDKPFGSIGSIEDLYPPNFPEMYITIVSFPQFTTTTYMSHLANQYQKWLSSTPDYQFLRIIFFVPTFYEDAEFYTNSKMSKFLVFETEVMLNEPFHVFIFESPRTKGEIYEDLFEIDFQQEFESQHQSEMLEVLPRYVRDIIQELGPEAVLYTQKEIYKGEEET